MLSDLDYKSIFDAAPDGMSLSRLHDGLFLDVNHSFAEMLGYSRDEIIGKTSYELNFWHNFKDREKLVERIRDVELIDNFEADVVSQEGQSIHVILSVRLVELSHEKCMLASIKNVTPLAEATRALQSSRKKFRDIFEMAPDCMIISDYSGYIHDVNPMFESALGYSREEIVGKTTIDVGIWTNMEDRAAFLSAIKKDGKAENFEVKGVVRSGKEKVFLVSAMPILVEEQERILTIAREVTGIKSAEQKLREEESRYRQLSLEQQTILEAIPDSVVLWTHKRDVVWANKNAQRYLKLDQDKAVGKNCREICQVGHNHEDCPLFQCLKRREPFEALEKLSDGETWDMKAFPLFSEDGQVSKVLTLSRNITEKIRLREEVSRSSRLSALGELAAGVAHEINNPTGLILMNASLARDIAKDLKLFLDDRVKDPGALRLGGLAYQKAVNELPEVLTETIESGQRIKQIVEDLKDFSKPAPQDTFEPVDLNEVVEKSLRLTRIAVNKATDNFVVDYDKTLPKILGNARQLEQVMVNLISNACQALQDKTESLVVAVFEEPNHKTVCIKVWDEGQGIDEKDLSQITDPFFTTKREMGGTGLGLSVSSRIVEEHHGHLYIESTPQYGTTVTVKFPAITDGGEKEK